MITKGSRFFFGFAALAYVGAIVYGLSTGGHVFGVFSLGYKEGVGEHLGYTVEIQHYENPRVEKEEHYYNAKHSKFSDMGLQPHLLTDDVVARMWETVRQNQARVHHSLVQPDIKWKQG